MGMPALCLTFPTPCGDFKVTSRRGVSAEFFAEFAAANPELRSELTAEGVMIVMPPVGWESGSQNAELTYQLKAWSKKTRTGQAFDSSMGYTLPNRAVLSPDASWMNNARVLQSEETKDKAFRSVCPNFVAELRSKSDSLKTLQRKMEEYIANGAELGWLVDARKRVVYVYRPEQPVEIVVDQKSLSADPELPGFVLDLTEIFDID